MNCCKKTQDKCGNNNNSAFIIIVLFILLAIIFAGFNGYGVY